MSRPPLILVNNWYYRSSNSSHSYICMTIKDVYYLFMYFWAPSIYLNFGCIFFSFTELEKSLHSCPLLYVYIVNIFFWSVAYIFSFLTVFWRAEYFSFDEDRFITFFTEHAYCVSFFTEHAYCVSFKKSFPIQSYKDSVLCVFLEFL